MLAHFKGTLHKTEVLQLDDSCTFKGLEILVNNNNYAKINTHIYIYMIDSDQRSDSNRCPLLNRHPLTSLSQITVRFKSAFFLNSHIFGRFIGKG